MLTGDALRRVDIVHDAAIAESGVDRGQIGAARPGHGLADQRGIVVGRGGRLRTHAPSTYKIPGSRDVPPISVSRILADAPNRDETIFRSKAVGEPPLMLAISVWLAIRDAIASVADHKRAPRLSTRRPRRSACCWR